MISAILFGRNDDHGVNFRHRALLSMNVLAEQLGRDDEIVFVDWNTPDGAPTFPESVMHSLTERARHLVRIVRIDADIHAEFVERGATMAVVPVVAYNVGIRRANPSARWILITTTDMLLVSREVGRTLSHIAETLPDGVYGLPRFELPRWIWQGLDPSDPIGAADCLSAFAKRLHLEEAIRLPAPELFDAPGDFQLVLRADLMTIDGFDEAMAMAAAGPDSNLLKRLALSGRMPESLEHQLAGYHCDHTSFPTASHRSGRVENDRAFFFKEVKAPDLPFQRSNWGLADHVLPPTGFCQHGTAETPATSKLGPADQSAAALLVRRLVEVAAALAPAQTQAYDPPTRFNNVGYPSKHVVPFLLDYVFEHTGPIVYIGGNETLASFLAVVLERLQPQPALVRFQPQDCAAFARYYADHANDAALPLLIFDFGIDALSATPGVKFQQTDAAVRSAIWHVRERFIWCAERERELSRRKGRSARIVAINSANTEFERLILSHLDCGLVPFTTRTRGGRVNPTFPPDVPVAAHPAARHMAERLGRRRGIHVGEFSRAWAVANGLVRAPPAGRLPSTWLAPSVCALLDWPGIAAALNTAAARIAQVKSRTAAERPFVRLEPPRPRRRDRIAAAKLASLQDWEDPEWYDFAYWYMGDHRSYNAFQRHRGDWEHIHFLFCLRRLGILDTDAEVVVLAHSRSRFAPMLARRVRKVHLVNIGWGPNKRLLQVSELHLDSSIRVYSGPSDPALRDVAAAALIGLRPFTYPFAGAGLRRACRAVEAGGIVGISFDVGIGPPKGLWRLGQWLYPEPTVDDLDANRGPAARSLPREFEPLASADWSVDPESFELVAPGVGWRRRQMTTNRCGRRVTSAICWFGRRA